MTTREPGLVSREIVEANDNYIVMEEIWDLTAPGCPFVQMKLFDAPLREYYHRQLRLTQREALALGFVGENAQPATSPTPESGSLSP